MRSIKILILTAVAATALLALIGSASASAATVLCKTSESPCGSSYPSGTEISASLASGTKLVFSSGFIKVTCSESTLTGSTTAGSGLPASISGLSYSKCTENIGGSGTCSSVGSEHLPFSATIAYVNSEHGTLSLNAGSGGAPLFAFTCEGWPGVTYTCKYKMSEFAYNLNGGNPGTLSATEVQVARESGSSSACSATGKITATYQVNSPKPVYVRNGKAALCSSQVSPCPEANRYAAGTALKAELSGRLKLGFGTTYWECSSSTLEGKTASGSGEGAAAEITAYSAGLCTAPGSWSCSKFRGNGLPWSTSFVAGLSGDGKVVVSHPQLEVVCNINGFEQTCFYGAETAEFTFHGGSAPEIVGTKIPMARQLGSSGGCIEVAELEATYKFSQPTPLYIETL